MPTEYGQTTAGGVQSGHARSVAMVDARAPRFGQALTTVGLGLAIVLDLPLLVYAVATVLTGAVVSGWRLDLYGTLWRRVGIPILGPPTDREVAAPHRFSRVLGAVFTVAASGFLLTGVPFVGYALAAVVAGLAALAATTGFCLGCRLYGQVRLFRRFGIV